MKTDAEKLLERYKEFGMNLLHARMNGFARHFADEDIAVDVFEMLEMEVELMKQEIEYWRDRRNAPPTGRPDGTVKLRIVEK